MINKYKLQINILLFASIFALSLAYIGQYFFNLHPCILCLYQRIPYVVIIIIALISLFFGNKIIEYQKYIIIVLLLLILFNIILAFYHVGVENGFFVFTGCGDTLGNIDNIQDLREQILQIKSVKCDEIQFEFLNISIAGWNIIYSIFIIILVTSIKFLPSK
ncbi:disulfide bond formation protein B [Rickettsiales bacterium]|nr:disulfide bond formation protein B [Rickettsiales bacterium]